MPVGHLKGYLIKTKIESKLDLAVQNFQNKIKWKQKKTVEELILVVDLVELLRAASVPVWRVACGQCAYHSSTIAAIRSFLMNLIRCILHNRNFSHT